MLRTEIVSGTELERYIPDLARLRISVFRDFPYLYDGDTGYEERYLQTYTATDDSIIVLALDGDKVVGAASGLPLAEETQAFTRPFSKAGLDPATFYYCAESVLLPEYRGQGLGHRFFDAREQHARSLGLEKSCFCAVQRPENHPRRPVGYMPLDNFWRKRGYRPRPDLTTGYRWKDLGDSDETEKPMMFWLKDAL